MSILLETCIYLMVVLALMLVTIAFFKDTTRENNSNIMYIRKKEDTSSVKLKLYVTNLSKEEISKIKEVIQKGEFKNILDVVDDFKTITKNS